MKKIISGYDRASVLDLAFLAGGSMECAISLCEENGICLTDDVEIDRAYSYDRISEIDKKCQKQIQEDSIKPATALSIDEIAVCPYGGINFMGIEIDFEVS